MEAKLIIVKGKANKAEVTLKLPSTIGRGRDADLTIAHPMISRHHCQLFEVAGLVKIRDLGSLNGTFLGDQQVKEADLYPHTEFSIGPLTFRVEYEYAGPVAEKPAPTEPVLDLPPLGGDALDLLSIGAAPASEGPLPEASPEVAAVAGATSPQSNTDTLRGGIGPRSEPASVSTEDLAVSASSADENSGSADLLAELEQATRQEPAVQAPSKKRGWWPFGKENKQAHPPAPTAPSQPGAVPSSAPASLDSTFGFLAASDGGQPQTPAKTESDDDALNQFLQGLK